jgi:hypothetical protein
MDSNFIENNTIHLQNCHSLLTVNRNGRATCCPRWRVLAAASGALDLDAIVPVHAIPLTDASLSYSPENGCFVVTLEARGESLLLSSLGDVIELEMIQQGISAVEQLYCFCTTESFNDFEHAMDYFISKLIAHGAM